ncbi:MAG: hypothetical protein ABJF89_10490 [Parasphingorhabdus sp.]|uniref:hypothetical protein n=1 Tax=Alphaproteobacteria TaxID=28211 RepID=UPI0032635BA4
MKRKLAITICLVFLASGLIRIGVSLLMIGQALGWWAFGGEATEALSETQRFIAEREYNLVGFTPLTYFGFIMFMGITISLGAIGQMWRKHWGLVLIGIYLLSHGALFVNFMTVNPKIFLWGLSVLATMLLIWANRKAPPESQTLAA